MKKNKLFMAIATLFLVMAFTVVGGTTSEAAGKTKYLMSGKFYYKVLPKNKLELIGTKQEGGTLTIPGYVTYKGKKYTVTRITDCRDSVERERKEAGCTYELNLPSRYKDYRPYSPSWSKRWNHNNFMSLQDAEIKKVVLPSTLTYIGEGAFYDEGSLKEVVFAKKYKKLIIGKNAFAFVKKIKFPDGTYELKEGAAGMASEIYIPASVKKIAPGVVNGWTKKVTISKKNKKFKMKAGILYSFDEKKLISASAKAKKNVKISNKTKSIGQNAFAETKVETVKLNGNITSIPRGAFARCFHLKKVSKAENVKKIGTAAFMWCENLHDIGGLPRLEEIGEDAFLYSGKLTLMLSSKIKVHNRAFNDGETPSDNLTICVTENDPVYSIVNGLLIKKDGIEQIVILQTSNAVNLVVPEGVTQIESCIGNGKTEKIDLPSTLNCLNGSIWMKEINEKGVGQVYFKGMTVPKFGAVNKELGWYIGHIFVPKGTLEAYKEAVEALDDETTYFGDDGVSIEEYDPAI